MEFLPNFPFQIPALLLLADSLAGGASLEALSLGLAFSQSTGVLPRQQAGEIRDRSTRVLPRQSLRGRRAIGTHHCQ